MTTERTNAASELRDALTPPEDAPTPQRDAGVRERVAQAIEAERDGSSVTTAEAHVALTVAARIARDGAEHACVTGPLCDGWPFAVGDAYRTIAAVAWPGERKENRDRWAVTMRRRPDLFEKEAARARERLEAAIARGRAAVESAPATREAELREQGRRLASERDDFIAQGVDPADLVVPLAPEPDDRARADEREPGVVDLLGKLQEAVDRAREDRIARSEADTTGGGDRG